VFTDEDSLIKKHNVIIKRLLVLKLLYFTDGLLSSFITHYFIAKMTIGHYIEFMLFYIIKLSPLTLVILRMPWLKKYNLGIDFPILEFKFDFNYYTYNCLL
jgi:intein/homing endonuclease